MATESPMRMVGSSGARKWSSSKETMAFTSSSSNVAAPELGFLLREHRFHANGRDVVPNRSGSAPPSMEGSFAAIKNLIGQQSSSLEGGFVSLNNAIKNCESEEQLRADPAYLRYYLANVNLNPRLPPPLISQENRRLAHHIGRFGDNRRLTSFDDSSSKSLFLSQGALSTHKEEPEDEKSPRQASGEWADMVTGFLSEQVTSSLDGRHKSLVDLIQEDFPRTPSPVYSQALPSSHATVAEEVGIGEPDVHGNPLHDSSTSSSKLQEPKTAIVGISVTAPSGVPNIGSMLNSDLSPETPIPSSSSPDIVETLHPSFQGGSNGEEVHFDNDIDSIDSEMKGFSISNVPEAGTRRSQLERQHLQSHNLPRHQLHPQRGPTSQVQGANSQMITHGVHNSYNGLDHLSHGQSKFSTVEVQPALQTSGFTTQLYSNPTAYMNSGNPFYPNLQPSSIFPPQYSLGGFTMNAPLFPPFFAGYPPHNAIPVAFENSAGPSFSSRPPGVSAGGGIAPGIDLQHLYKFYGQLGLPLQPSFPDPLYMHYFQHPSEDAYRASGQFDPIAMRGGVIGSQDSFDLQKGIPLASYSADQKPHYPRSGTPSIQNTRKMGITSPNSYGSPSSMGVLMQYPTSPLSSPVLPGSPMSGAGLPGRKNENLRFPLVPNRNLGAYSGWQGQSGSEKIDDSKHSFLEELKSSKARRFELSDIAGRIVEFSADQHGSRFIQQKLENCSAEEKASVFEEVLPHAQTLMTDVFGNYVIQKFFEHGSTEQRKELANQLAGRILILSLQMYGCRVIQKALEVIELDQKTQLVLELDGHVMRCVRDQNGNHVIQKCIECVPTERIGFIIYAFRGQVANLSTHPYGCRVIQRVLEHCTDEQQTQCIVDEILQSACSLAQDQYGNYVTQHVLEKGKSHERSQIISKLAGQIVQMSQHKFASNVIEKCLEHGDSVEREFLIEQIVGQTEGNDNLLVMMKDQFANYVVQKILDTCTDKQREILLNRMRAHLQALKKYTYGKHIVARVEQLSGEETLTPES